MVESGSERWSATPCWRMGQPTCCMTACIPAVTTPLWKCAQPAAHCCRPTNTFPVLPQLTCLVLLEVCGLFTVVFGADPMQEMIIVAGMLWMQHVIVCPVLHFPLQELAVMIHALLKRCFCAFAKLCPCVSNHSWKSCWPSRIPSVMSLV